MSMNQLSENTFEIPENPDGIGAVQDENRAFFFGFSSHRDIFVKLGYLAVPADDTQLVRCADCACDLLYKKPLLRGMTLSVQELLESVSEGGIPDDPVYERNAAMILTAIHQAVEVFAGSRKEVSYGKD
jgi:hypothetical protein